MEAKPNQSLFNDVKNRFLTLPPSAAEGLEHEPKKTDFEYIKELGEGSYGQVYLVSHKKTKAIYALKIIDKYNKENLEVKENFNREIEIMYKLNHPNIVKLYGHFEDDRYCYFLMQYIPKKSLYDIIPEIFEKKNLKLVASIIKDVCKAVYYLHKMRPIIIHRDIKSDNILLDGRNKAYLTDFGWSNYIEGNRKRTTACGTPVYLPPEIVKETGHDESVDIWCIGVLLFLLTTGQYPFWGNSITELENKIKKLNINWPKNMDPDAKDLITKILKLNPKERPTIQQILNHKFISTYYPNVESELIKPDHQERKIFVVSKDNPKTWGPNLKKNVKFQEPSPINTMNTSVSTTNINKVECKTDRSNEMNSRTLSRKNHYHYSIHVKNSKKNIHNDNDNNNNDNNNNNTTFVGKLAKAINLRRNNSNNTNTKKFTLRNSVENQKNNNNNNTNFKTNRMRKTNNITLLNDKNKDNNNYSRKGTHVNTINYNNQKEEKTNTQMKHHTYYVSKNK